MKNLDILSFNTESKYVLPCKRREEKKARALSNYINDKKFDVVTLQEVGYDFKEELTSNLKEYFPYALVRGANKTDFKNIIFLKKGIRSIKQKIYTLSDNIHLPTSKAEGSFFSNNCNVIKINYKGSYLTIFNTQLDKVSKKGRNNELKQLDYLYNLPCYDGNKIITIDAVSEVNRPLLDFIRKNNLKIPTLKLGSSVVDKEGNGTSHILLSDELDSTEVSKESLLDNGKVLNPHYMVRTNLILQKKL